ncbi:response regulator transcription factor [Terriglobus sp. ADX1]|uniref:response regulator transcription factor n=1 Tax=Terriglobus sp. ADX1 TaxID=2794063 RepID=UPI002FE4FEA7
MRVLVIEDDAAIQDFLKRGLSEAGYVADQATTARAAERLVCEQDYAAIVLDLGLPDRDGFDLMSSLRSQGVIAPMLILSARRSVTDRVRGLEQGGDDYLTKPFAIAELTARLRNLVRRSLATSGNSANLLRAGDIELDLLRREATRGSRMLRLTSQEFALLEFLVRNAGRVVTRSMILEQVWKVHVQPDTNVVDVHIYRLRSKVDLENEMPMIRTLRGVGYVLRDR